MENWRGRRIPNLLKKYRRVRGLRQKDVAMILDLRSPSRISRWEKGLCLPSLTNALRLAAVYRVMVDAIFPDILRSLRKELKKQEDEVFGRRNATHPHA